MTAVSTRLVLSRNAGRLREPEFKRQSSSSSATGQGISRSPALPCKSGGHVVRPVLGGISADLHEALPTRTIFIKIMGHGPAGTIGSAPFISSLGRWRTADRRTTTPSTCELAPSLRSPPHSTEVGARLRSDETRKLGWNCATLPVDEP